MTADPGATERAKEATSTAVDQGRHVGGVAMEETRNVAGAATEQARGVLQDAVSQVGDQLGEQAAGQKERLAGTLRSFGDDLSEMVDRGGTSGMAADLAREVADRARSLGSTLESREPTQLLDDVRDFARRRPGTFLLGALAAGVVAGRVLRGAKDEAQNSEHRGQPTAAPESTTVLPTADQVTGPGSPGYSTPGQATVEAP